MTGRQLLGGLAGASITGGLLLVVVGVTGWWPGPGPGAPPGALIRWWRRVSGAALPVAERRARGRRWAGAVLTGLGVLAGCRMPVLAFGAAAAVVVLPRVLARRSAGRARIARLEALETWTRRLSDVMAAHAALEAGIAASVRTAPPAIEDEVRALGARLAAHWPAERALRAFAADVADPVGDVIAAALILTARRRGPALVRSLRTLAASVAAEVAVRRDVEADREKPRSTARILTVLVVAAVAFVMLVPRFRQPYQTVTGEVVLAAALGLLAGCFAWMWRIADARPGGRFLGADDGFGLAEGPAGGGAR